MKSNAVKCKQTQHNGITNSIRVTEGTFAFNNIIFLLSFKPKLYYLHELCQHALGTPQEAVETMDCPR